MEEMRITKEYWNKQCKHYIWDDYVLKISIESLDPEERAIILKKQEDMTPDEKNRFNFIMYRIFNRHFDVINGRTEIMVEDDGKKFAQYTKKSAITELDISYPTFVNCYHSMIFTIADIEKPMVSTVSLQSMTEIMRLLISMGVVKDALAGVPAEV